MTQLKFNWDWAQRKRWIDEAQIDSGVAYDNSRVSASAMAGLLNVINDHLGENAEAWPSQETVAQKLKVSIKTVQRASQALAAKSLLIIENRKCKSGTQNFYRIVWTELQILEPSRRASWNAMLRGREPSDTLTEPSDTLTEPSDTLTEPSDTLTEPSDIVSAEQPRTTKNRNEQQPLQTSHGNLGTAQVVVVSLEDVLEACHVLNPANTLRLARDVLRLSNSEIEERIAAFKARPEDQQNPGVLVNWLTKPRSYAAKPSEPPKLKLQQGLTPPQERQRADLIRYGRKQGWSHAQLQAAIERFESKLTN